jgi:hypothetical protein
MMQIAILEPMAFPNIALRPAARDRLALGVRVQICDGRPHGFSGHVTAVRREPLILSRRRVTAVTR